MQLALLDGGSDPPLIIPWWILFASLTAIYNSWNLESCFWGLFAISQIKLLFLAIQDVKNIKTFEEYYDLTHPDTRVELPPGFTFFKPYPRIIPEEVDAFWVRVIREMLLDLLPTAASSFEGRETESNWNSREQTITRMRTYIFDLEPETKSLWLSQIKSMLNGLLKCPNSLRTTVSTTGCLLFQDIAKVYGSGIDGMVEILLQNFIKLCANTKLITRVNANDTVLAIIGNVSYHIRIVQHIHSACQDKNVHPRKFACEWLKKVIKRHPRSTIEHHGGLDLIEKSIKLGLEDRDKNVREAMRPTYWNFARRWPERSEIMFSNLDKAKQDQLLADPSNPNATPSTNAAPSTASAPAKSNTSVQRGNISAVAKNSVKESEAQHSAHEVEQKPSRESDKAKASVNAKPTLKEIKAALKKAQSVRNDTNIATSDAQPGAASAQKPAHSSNEDVDPAKESSQIEGQGAKAGSISAAPLRRKKTTATTKMSQSQNKILEHEVQGSSAPIEEPEAEAVDVSSKEEEETIIQIVESQDNSTAPPHAPSSPQMTPQMFENEREKRKRAGFLATAMKKLVARDMDVECFRILQQRLSQDTKSPVYKALIEPLCDWLETPTMPSQSEKTLEWQDEQYYALSTLRILLQNKIWAETFYPRIMLALTTANAWYKSKAHMVTGIRKGLDFLINHCNVLECLHALCQIMEYDREETEDEIRLLALGAMLHRIHSHPEQESAFYHLLGSEAEIVNRLGKIGSTAIQSEVASIRKAAISYAQEFWHLVPEADYFDLIGCGDEKTQNLLRYYISRHKKIDDHVEL